MQTLFDDIQAFLTKHEMPPTRFGELAMNDKGFVFRLEDGRDVRMSTAEKVRRFMMEYRPQEAA